MINRLHSETSEIKANFRKAGISNLHTVHVLYLDIYLERSDWFLLLTQIYSHQSETLSVVVNVRHQHGKCRLLISGLSENSANDSSKL